MPSTRSHVLRTIPSVDLLLQEEAIRRAAAGVPRRLVVEAVRQAVEHAREMLLAQRNGDGPSPEQLRSEIVRRALATLQQIAQPHYQHVINATGIILHTALGRAVLPKAAIQQIAQQLSGYSLLQAEIESGGRSKRDERIEWLLQQLTGTEAATVVNNNAAATAIVLNTVAHGREVIVSRGQLVEIGGAFRLPEVMASAGARLVEVGTTNRTHARDYERAITEHTAALMRVHPSNYKISGFTAEVSLEEMVAIARAHNLLVIDDVGAGSLVDVSRFGFEPEPTLLDSVRIGADLITASADKLIGSSQGGIILGRTRLVQAVRKNPLARILRVGKLTLAALEATLTLFLDPAQALEEIPTLRLLRRPEDEIVGQAQRIAAALAEQCPQLAVEVTPGQSQVGSGSLPTQNLPTRLVVLHSDAIEAQELALRLRRHRPSVFARIHGGRLLLDPRTLLPGEEEALVAAVVAVCQQGTEAAE